MNDEYKHVYRDADALRHRFRDVVDDANDHHAQALYKGLDNLAEDFEKQRSARSLEASAKRLAEEFKHANREPQSFMDSRHLNDFYSKLEQIAHHVRKFSNY